MREVKAIVRPQRLEQVMEALHAIPGLPGVTVSKVHAYAGFQRQDIQAAGDGQETDLTKLEIVVTDDLVESVVAAIGHASHTGRAGDGIVYVVPVERFMRVRALAQGAGASEESERTRADRTT